MTWSNVKKTLTTPPPPRPPPPKYPTFTKDFSSTTSFGPGHLVGVGLLALGVFGLAKFIQRSREEAEQTRQSLAQPPRPAGPLLEEPKLANVRGQYVTRSAP